MVSDEELWDDYEDFQNIANTSAVSDEELWEDYGDYYDIEQRIHNMLQSPHEVIAVLIGICAICLNILVFAGLYHVKNRITTHCRLIISLAASDLVVGGSVMAHIINKVVNPVYQPGFAFERERLVSKCVFLVIKALNTTGLNVNLLNLMVMALDHYMAIMKPMQYPVLMTKKRVVYCIIILWTISLILGFSDFLSAISEYSSYKQFGYNYCEVVWITKYQEEFTVLAVAPVCFVAMFYAYLRIYIKVRRHQRPGEGAIPSRRTPKALITTLLNLGSFMITWLPLCLFQIILLIQVHYYPEEVQKNIDILSEVDKYLFDLLMVNSIADSIIYTVRVHEVKVGLRRLFRCPVQPPLRRVTISQHSGSTGFSFSNYKLRNMPSPNGSSTPIREFRLLA